MVGAGLGQEIIIAKINSTESDFETTPGQLAELKKAGVSDPIILAMIKAPKGQGETVFINCLNSQREVHSTAFYASPTLAEVPCGDALNLLGSENGYIKVRTQQGVVGYVMEEYVSKTKPETPKAEQAVVVISPPSRPAAAASGPTPALPSNMLRAVAWRAVPWVTTTYYQQPGTANSDCTGSGTWLGNIYQANASCSTQFTPAQNVPINWTHYTIYNLVETRNTFLVLACTRNWAFSKCSHLIPGNEFPFEDNGGKVSVTGQRGGKSKQQTLTFDLVSTKSK